MRHTTLPQSLSDAGLRVSEGRTTATVTVTEAGVSEAESVKEGLKTAGREEERERCIPDEGNSRVRVCDLVQR